MKNPAGKERGSRTRVATVSEVCERHIAAVADPRTARTCRARLGSVIDRYGELTVPEALRRLGAIEGELAGERGQAAAHKTTILFKASARAAGFELLTLIAARQRYGIAVSSLRVLVDDERVRYCYRHTHGRGEMILFDPDELAEDLRQLDPCREPSCDRAGTGPSGYCGEHFAHGGRAGAAEKEDQTLAARRDWWTVTEAAQRAGVPVQSAVARGELPSDKVGRHRRVPKAALASWRSTRQPARVMPTPEQRAARRLRVADAWERGERQPGVLATELGVSKPTIYSDLEALGLERPGQGRHARALSPGPRAARAARVVDRYAQGASYRQIADAEDVSETAIGRILRAAGVTPRPKRRKPTHPPARERPCAFCGSSFVPRAPAFGDQRYCSTEHAHAARAKETRDALADRGLLATDELGIPGMGQHQVLVHIKAGRLAAELVDVPGALRPVYGVTPEARTRFSREFAQSGDGRRRVLERPEPLHARWQANGTAARLQQAGHSLPEVTALASQAAEERRRYFAAMRRTGRPRRTTPPAHHVRWLQRFDELVVDRDYHHERLALGTVDESDGPVWDEATAAASASDTKLFQMVAAEDWRTHPECWSRDKYPPSPNDPTQMTAVLVADAGRIVRRAVKRLQIDGAESPTVDLLSL